MSLSFPLSLSLSPFSLLTLFCFLSCSKMQLHHTESLWYTCIALFSHMYERLSDCPKVTGCIFLQPQGRGGFINQNSLGVNFPEEVFSEQSKNWRFPVFLFN